EALDRLEHSLREANRTLQEDSRDAVIMSIRALIDFVHSMPRKKEGDIADTLFALLTALADLNDGRTVPMLAPARGINNRKPEARARKILKAYVCFTIDELMRADLSVEQASRLLAGELEGAG